MGFLSRLSAAALSALRAHAIRYRTVWIGVGMTVGVIVLLYVFLLSAPYPFPRDTQVVITEGATAKEAAHVLQGERIVRSASVLSLLLRVHGASGHIHPGVYRFENPENAIVIMERITSGDFGIPPARLRFIEGATVRDMAAQVAAALPEISASDFIALAGPYEGYLFPDTYFFSPDATAASIVKAMRSVFEQKISPLHDDILASGRSLNDIIIMASLVEKEGRSPESKRMIAGILWNRIDHNMPLQVDAVFGYIFGRDTYSPSFEDLGVDSPYNTYTHRGLPPGPIDNPGMTSILAAIEPAKTDYLYYLTGKDGLMHYAKTYAGQLANQRKYLQ